MAIENGYATLAQVKAAARIADGMDDELLEMAIETSSRMIDDYTGRRFYTAGTETRYYNAADPYRVYVDDLAGTPSMVKTSSGLDGVYDVTWNLASDLQYEPLNRVSGGMPSPITKMRAVGDYLFPVDRLGEVGVLVTGVFGYATTVPTQIKHACVLTALRQFKRYDSPTGVLGIGSDLGVVRVGRIDPDVQAILSPFRRPMVGLA